MLDLLTLHQSTATTDTMVSFTFSASDADGDTIVDSEWTNYNEEPQYYTAGSQRVKVRVKDSKGTWSNWFTYEFTVANTGSPSSVKIIMSPNQNTISLSTTVERMHIFLWSI